MCISVSLSTIVFLLLPSICISFQITTFPILQYTAISSPKVSSISTNLYTISDNQQLNHDDGDHNNVNVPSSNANIMRKSFHNVASKVVAMNSIIYYILNNRMTISSAVADDVSSTTASTSDRYINKLNDVKPEITDRVYIDVKIANYTEESVGKNRGATGSGRIVIGLYGKAAPLSCKIFLDTIRSDGSSTPSYRNSQLSRITDDGSLIEVEKIRGLNTILLAGTDQYEYDGNIMDTYKPILESNGIKHDRIGLLSRRQLSSTPEFGITLKSSAELDAFHVVFGVVLEGFEVIYLLCLNDITYVTMT